MKDCIFCKIVAGKIPSYKVYESADALAFLDAQPNTPGHTLVIPKKHVENIFDTDPATLAASIEAVRIVAPAVRDGVGAKGVHVNSNHGVEAGQIIPHLHWHVIPRHDRTEFDFSWPHGTLVPDEATAVAAQIRACLVTAE